MNKVSKQFDIIKKIKAMIKSKGPIIPNNSSMSSKMASQLQDTAYEYLKSKSKKEVFSPTYIKIAEHLCVQDNQIFCGAVFNLANIAINIEADRAPILEILSKALEDNKTNSDRAPYISQKIAEINAAK